MTIAADINNEFGPNNGYLPPYPVDNAGLRIVVEDNSPRSESEAEESALQPRVASAAPADGYNYKVPEDKLPPTIVVPSHTLDDQGYHYMIPNVPFLS